MVHVTWKVKVIGVASLLIMGWALFTAIHPALADVTGNCLYVVHVGDSLGRIATRHNVPLDALYQQNRGVIGANRNRIYPGQHLNVCIDGGGTTYKAAAQTVVNPAQDTSTAAIRADIMSVFGPTYGPGAIGVAICESSLNPNAYNPQPVYWNSKYIGNAKGLFQIVDDSFNETPEAGQSEYDALVNIHAAYWLFARDGYTWRAEWPDTQHCA